MSAPPRLRTLQRVAVAVAGVGLAATAVAPAASAHGSHSSHRHHKHSHHYTQPTCKTGAYNCVPASNPKPTTPTKPVVVPKPSHHWGWYTAPVKWYVVKAPHRSKVIFVSYAKCYRVVSWFWR